MVDFKKQINVRIIEELYNKIEREDRAKQDIISDALLLYFDRNSKQDLATSLEHCQEKNRLLESNLRTIEQQLGFLQLEYQKMTDRLMLPAPKSWWQFWK